MASECTQEAVLKYLQEQGGRVKNRELIDHFKVSVTRDPAAKSTFKDTLKRFVDNVAFVKQEDGEKFVCLKRKYREDVPRTVEGNDEESNGNGLPADAICPPKRTESSSINGAMDFNNGNDPNQVVEPDVICKENAVTNMNMTLGSLSSEIHDSLNTLGLDTEHELLHSKSGTSEDKLHVERSGDSCSLQNSSKDEHKNHNHSTVSKVFDTTVNCPKLSTELGAQEDTFDEAEEKNASSDTQEPLNRNIVAKDIGTDPADSKGPTSNVVIRRRTSRGSQRSLLGLSEEGMNEGAFDWAGDSNTPKGSRKNFIELMMSSSPQVRRTLVHRNSQSNLVARNRESLRSDGDASSLHSDEDCTAVTLDPLEHEWMMCASDGQWESLQRLLVCEPNLVTKRDFVTGFTSLHWAAKQGKPELIAKLLSFAKEHDMAVNVNTRSSAGYTPLHLAAMHNHVEVMKLLVGAFDADVEVRDYSGKKASQYVSSQVLGDLKDIIGPSSDSDVENAESGAGGWRFPKVLSSNLNPLRLLNHPDDGQGDNGALVRPRSLYRKSSLGRIRLNRNRFKTQIVHSTSFRETDEGEGSVKSPVKTRPLSNLFG